MKYTKRYMNLSIRRRQADENDKAYPPIYQKTSLANNIINDITNNSLNMNYFCDINNFIFIWEVYSIIKLRNL